MELSRIVFLQNGKGKTLENMVEEFLELGEAFIWPSYLLPFLSYIMNVSQHFRTQH